MKIDLNSLGREPRPFEFDLAEAEIDLGPGVRFPENVEVKGTVERKMAQVDISGFVRTRALIDCSRCLEPVAMEIGFPFEAVFVQPEDFAADKEREVSGDDLNVDILPGDQIDLGDIAREQLLLELPAQVFCSEDCKGLCDRCGQNLNIADCDCGKDEIDPRWAVLKNLR